jgi:hypothetical protein
VAQAKARPYLKNKLSKKVWGCTSSGRVPGPQFKPSYHQKKKKKKRKKLLPSQLIQKSHLTKSNTLL